jgi:hypothetical protein
MNPYSLVAWHVETNDSVESIRPVRIGNMTMRCDPVLHSVRAIRHLSQTRMAIYIVICGPSSNYRTIFCYEGELVSPAIEN